MKKYAILLTTAVLLASCNNWLDVTPEDKQLEKELYASEAGIQNATNGLYREMVGVELYGGQLSQTTVDLMGHAPTYPPNPFTDETLQSFYGTANFLYTDDAVKGRFSNIWSSAYKMLLHINVYIKNLKESPAVMSGKNKNILLGEAYGLRAYLHFDLFRLFGPAWQDRTGNKILPYNNKAQITLNHTGYEEAEYSTAEGFMQLLWDDITEAERLLKDADPIIDDAESITNDLRNDHFYQNRNRRMNYYAVKGLEARVRQYCGEDGLAVQAAKVITDAVGADSRFKWVDANKVKAYTNYIFFSEVIFGINNLAFISRGTDWYLGSSTEGSYTVDKENLLVNILGYSGELSVMLDIRTYQWGASNITSFTGDYSTGGTFKSGKYLSNTYKDIPAIKDLQVLMRISEMYYIQAEAALKAGDIPAAVTLLNTVLEHRGLTTTYYLPENAPETTIWNHMEQEYYREFIGEGQIFFFHKRRGSTKMFKGYEKGTVEISNPKTAYVVPIPDSEKNI